MCRLHLCNLSLVKPKERHDSELFYLKWIAKELATREDAEHKAKDMEPDEVEALFPRYKELLEKHGAMNLDTQNTERLMSVVVTIVSLTRTSDPVCLSVI